MEPIIEMAAHSSILTWRIPRTQEPGGLQSTGSQRVGHDWMTKYCGDDTYLNIGNVRLFSSV